MSDGRKGQAQAGKSPLPSRDDFPAGTTFLIKEFNVPLAYLPGKGWFNWFGGTPRDYDPSSLKPGNNWPPRDFEEWVQLIRPGRSRIGYKMVGENGSLPMIDFEASGRLEFPNILNRLPGFTSVAEMRPDGDMAWECNYETGRFRLVSDARDGGWTLAPSADRLNTISDILTLLRADPNYEDISMPSRQASGAVVGQQGAKEPALPTTVRLGLALSILLYAASLTQSAYHVVTPYPRDTDSGWVVLITGWFGLFDGMVAWLANPALLSAWIFAATGRRSKAIIAATAALFLALSFLLNQQITIDEAGHYGQLRHDGVGYWCWLASIAVAYLMALISHRSTQPTGAR